MSNQRDDQADAWEAVFQLCLRLGMELNQETGLEDVLTFIRELHKKAGAV